MVDFHLKFASIMSCGFSVKSPDLSGQHLDMLECIVSEKEMNSIV